MPKDEASVEKPLSPEVQQIQDLYQVMLAKGLDSLEIKEEDQRVKLTRRFHAPVAGGFAGHAAVQALSQGVPPSGALKPEAAPVDSGAIIATPLAGVFYRASSPTSVAFVNEGDVVDPGQTLCIVEAMKVMNEIKAESRCRIIKIVAENGRPVTSGQALFQFEPA